MNVWMKVLVSVLLLAFLVHMTFVFWGVLTEVVVAFWFAAIWFVFWLWSEK